MHRSTTLMMMTVSINKLPFIFRRRINWIELWNYLIRKFLVRLLFHEDRIENYKFKENDMNTKNWGEFLCEILKIVETKNKNILKFLGT